MMTETDTVKDRHVQTAAHLETVMTMTLQFIPERPRYVMAKTTTVMEGLTSQQMWTMMGTDMQSVVIVTIVMTL